MLTSWKRISVAALLVMSAGCGGGSQTSVLEGGGIKIEWNDQLHTRVSAVQDGKATPLGPFTPSETITSGDRVVTDFYTQGAKTQAVNDEFGTGKQITVQGADGALSKTVRAVIYDEYPSVAVFEVTYFNEGDSDIRIDSWTNNHVRIDAPADSAEPAFWSFQSGSYESRPDWILPLKAGFKQANFMGMNATDYGGGTPVSDVWSRQVGVAVGHLEKVPKLVSLPVEMQDAKGATLGVQYDAHVSLKAREKLTTFRTFVAVHHGDYFAALEKYRGMMAKRGITADKSPDDAFQPIWCAWGYGRNMVPQQIYGTFPMVKKLNFRWAGVDDGWQTAEGDWFLNPKKFPRGDADMKAIVDRIHNEGLRAQLWWAPLAVDPGTDLITNHPEYLLLKQDGSKQDISWWDSYYLCPAYKPVQENAKEIVTKMFRDWGYDGLKLDGQHMNGAPPCYNPEHHHSRPEESVEAMPEFFKVIYDTARSIKPDALVEFCPCGTAASFFTLPYANMTVASDPESSWQVRTKGKTLKALLGDSVAYFGDHVELSDGHEDFASSVGIGAVVGTNFTWPVKAGSDTKQKVVLTPEREKIWEKWIPLYREKMLSRGEYLGGLYDIGFDKPETHAIRKDGKMYYAFYAPEWKGDVELRGLESGSYRVADYVNGKELGTVTGPVGKLPVEFSGYLLVEAGR